MISGTPTVAGMYSVMLAATNSGGGGAAVLTLTILPATPGITSTPTAQGQVGVPFSFQVAASNGPTSFGATALPANLSADATGLITGTPITAGTFTATVSASNTGGTGSATLTLTILPATPVFTSASTAHGQVGVPFSFRITAKNIPTSYTATVPPSGLSFDSTTGIISGTPGQSGSFTLNLGATNGGGTGVGKLTLTIYDVPMVSVTIPSANGNRIDIVEGDPPLEILVQRTGGDPSLPLTVVYKPKGNCTPDVDYQALNRLVTIPAGATSATVEVVTFDTGASPNGSKLLKLHLTPATDGSYTIGLPLQAKLQIMDSTGG